MKKLDPALIRKSVYICITILPAILTGNIYQSITTDKISTTSRTSLTALGNTIYNQLDDSTNNIFYSLKLLSSSYEVKTYDLGGISRALNLYTYYNPLTCSSIFILDQNLETVYGVNTNQLNNITDTDHIKKALNGESSFYYKNDPTPFAQLVYPIFSTKSSLEVTGVMVATINLDFFRHALSVVSDIDSNYNAYLIDSTGLVTISSKNTEPANKPQKFNLDDIRYSISYSPDGTFKNYEGVTSYGVFHEIKNISCTLLVTYDNDSEGVNISDYIGYILGLLGAGTVTTSEALRKKKYVIPPSTLPTTIDPCEICQTLTQEESPSDIKDKE